MEINNPPICVYCNKKYKSDAPLLKHLVKCKKKHQTPRYFKRIQHKDDTNVRIGYYAYLKYHERYRTKKTLAQFLNSLEYKGFVRFGDFCLTLHAVDIGIYGFTNYIIEKELKLDKWTDKSLYTEYIYDLIISESPIDALERAIRHSIQWAERYNKESKNIIRDNSDNVICYDIINGFISPWVLYTCESGIEFLNNLDKEHAETIHSFINPKIWELKVDANFADVSYLKSTLKELEW